MEEYRLVSQLRGGWFFYGFQNLKWLCQLFMEIFLEMIGKVELNNEKCTYDIQLKNIKIL